MNDPHTYNIVRNDEKVAQKQTLFFITCGSDCPLIFSQRLGWSYLVKCRKTKRNGTQTDFANLVGYRRDRCRRVFERLIKEGIAERPHHRSFVAQKPNGKHEGWFVARKVKNDGDWVDRLAYFPVAITGGPSILDDVMLGLVRSLAGKKGSAQYQSYAGLASMLGCAWTTAKASLTRLEKDKQLELVALSKTRFGNMERFDVLVKNEVKKDVPAAPEANAGQDVTIPEINETDDPTPTDRELCMKFLLNSKIPNRLASEIVDMVLKKCHFDNPFGVLLANLEDAGAKHRGKADHPGFLLKHMIRELVDRKEREWRTMMLEAC